MSKIMTGEEFSNWYNREATGRTPVWCIDDGSGWGTDPYMFAETASEASEFWNDANNPFGVEGVPGQPWQDGQPERLKHIWAVEVQGVVEVFAYEDKGSRLVGPFNTVEEAQKHLRLYTASLNR